MKRVLIVTGWCLAIASVWVSTAAVAADRFAQRFALELDSGAAYYSVTLPAAVYAASQCSDLGDVRVFNGAGEPVPYSLDTPREPSRTPATLRPVRWFPMPPAAPGGTGAPLGVTIAADGSLRATSAPPSRAQDDADLIDIAREARAGSRVEALVVHVRDDNYQGRVNVESSDDLRNWQPAGEAQLLKVSYNGSTLSQDRIELNGMRARYLRLRWLDGAPYIESIEAQVQAASADHAQRAGTQQEWRVGIVARTGPKTGEYFFETGGPYPIDRLRLNLPQPNTVAPAVVYSRAGLETAWREVSSATLFRLHNGTVEQSNPSLEMAPDTDRQWRVVVDTRNGGLGSGALTVAAGWRPATLTFVARGAAPFTLAVGSAAAVSSAVSRADLLMGASSVVVAARLGEVLPDEQDADAQSPGKDPDAMRRYMLWAALLLAVGSLGAIAWRLVRRAQFQAQAPSGSAPVEVPDGGGGTGGVGGTDGLAGDVPSGSGAANVTVKDTGAADADGQSTGKN
ncbi:hypothetical protein R69927_03616 [Paraburkholderia domus]|jgi:hypothetical protein|uniref:DUF3999 domain-containing protein n=1 Tax=Paraburkholderia domus TaxID=2793075 RepID=A0A9N8MYA3_9BURK|nr:DUF3999 domain-containing protein [Paraburkholderia domus]MBK5053580.1 DUF3999 domain-containing protein [Burkholderia sp. R-70006]MBK5062378.1 DUF3999 domain-containing protein [Burkholderia sp. R-70199]MBK5087882.1 DUF3999 domain-containing protein [Burkholderia sp. R-69927]MBK5120738.1 DUF3999 domain-containing protein [Burkholderia sp. R-69980]MBK5166984.1 DUF3999 domain-containing protein [Burkholderia sp. R-70211]MBK5181428.1 DUF3999 domain-containing protein [Burkholderia sp. R-6974